MFAVSSQYFLYGVVWDERGSLRRGRRQPTSLAPDQPGFLPLMGGDGDYAQYWHPECRLIILSASRPFDDDRGKRKTTTDSAFFAPEARTGKDESRVRPLFLEGRTFFPLFLTQRNGSDEWSIGSSPTMRCWTESRAFFDVASQTRVCQPHASKKLRFFVCCTN